MSNSIKTTPSQFNLTNEADVQNLLQDILKNAKTKGATSAEVAFRQDVGLDVSARMGEPETLEFNRDKTLALTVYFGQQKGSASTADITPQAVEAVLSKACDIAKFTSSDPFAGLADANLMASDYPSLNLDYPWSISSEEAIQLAAESDKHGLELDKRIVNSDGSNVSTNRSLRVYANSHGFIGGLTGSRHSMSSVFVAKSKDKMQRDYWYTVARDALDLESHQSVAQKAVERTIGRLGARRIKTQSTPVIFSPEMASGLFSSFIGAISGGSLYRKSSFLLDHLGKQVFPSFMRIHEQPHLDKGLGSTPFDSEGVKTAPRDIITDGVLQGYVLSSYSARKLNLTTTANAGGVHNLTIAPGQQSLKELLKEMNTGLLVTDLMGQGVNIVTGNYSRGAGGFWVENGEIQFPVEEVTIAGNLKDMFMNIRALGNDVDKRSNILTPSVWIDNMMVAGE